ncbi:MAG: VCBS repeat-containing protein [Planctomycetota bacterium]|nr:MAG: VCBS repeat-containing protein [Planctomycetota bacterium]
MQQRSLRVGVLLALAAALAPALHAQQLPLADRWFPVVPGAFTSPVDVRIEHLDGDGRLDVLALVRPNAVTTEWYATRSNAQLAAGFDAPLLVSNGQPVGDLNGDGRTDFVRVLAVADTPTLSTTFGVQLSNGGGGYASLAPQTIQWSLSSIQAGLGGADFDHDGNGDLFAFSEFAPQLFTIDGDGAGGLSHMIGNASGAQSTTHALAADLEGDGDVDLVYCTAWSTTVSVLPSVGPGWFAAPVVEDATSVAPGKPVLLDFDLDGDLDAAYRASPVTKWRYLRGDGVGGFAPPLVLTLPTGAVGITDLIAADADDDGDADLVVDLFDGLGVHRAGPGAVPGAVESLGAWRKSALVRHADLDADGQREWIALQTPGVALVEPSGPKATQVLETAAAFGGSAWCAADFDGDARADVALVQQPLPSGLELRAFRWNGAAYALVDAEPIAADGCSAALAADFDLDGRVDVCASMRHGSLQGSLDFFGGLGDGSFISKGALPALGSLGALQYADLDADGDGDLAALTTIFAGGQEVAVRPWLGDGQGGFAPGAATPHVVKPTNVFLDLADFDLDGALDALLPGAVFDRSFAIAHGDGAGGFAAPQSQLALPNGVTGSDALARDIDADGRPDVVLCCYTTQQQPASEGVYAVLGTAGGFAAPTPLWLGMRSLGLGAADLDRDGALELLVERDTAFAIAKGAGTTWSVLGSASPQASLRSLRAVDQDGSAGLDVLALSNEPGSDKTWLSLLPNVLGLPNGLAPYGAGTPSCAGTIHAVANLAPKVGESEFKLSWTNAPASSHALVGIAFAQDFAGSDALGLGVNFHIGLLGPVLVYNAASDASGAAALAFPVPSAPQLAGLKAYAQALWIEPAWQSCSSSPLPWSSSTGLEVMVLP